jgi:hypothetical protein
MSLVVSKNLILHTYLLSLNIDVTYYIVGTDDDCCRSLFAQDDTGRHVTFGPG